MKKFLLAASILGALCGPAKAELLASATHEDIASVQGLLPIYYRQPYLTFATSRANQRVVVRYEANCNTDGWLYIRAFIDGQLTYPYGYNVFCQRTANAYGEYLDRPVTLQRTYVAKAAGRHTLTLEALFYGSWYTLGFGNLTVER